MQPISDQNVSRASADPPSPTSGDLIPAVLDLLVSEIRRYLEVVDVFRAEGCEPRWA